MGTSISIKIPFSVIVLFLLIILLLVIQRHNNKQTINEYTEQMEELCNKISLKDSEDKGKKLYELSLGLDYNNPNRIKILEQAKDEKNIYAAITLGNIYTNGIPEVVEKDYENAKSIYESIENIDHTGISHWLLGWMYENGQLGVIDKDKALEYYEKSSKRGYAKAFNSLGKLELAKSGEEHTDMIKATNFFTEAHQRGDVFGTLNLASTYKKEHRDYHNAKEFYDKAIKANCIQANMWLGKLYLEHRDCEDLNISNQEIVNLFDKVIKNPVVHQEYKACSYFYLGEIAALNDQNCEMPESEFPYKVEAFHILYPLHITNSIKTHIGKEIYEKLERLLK